MGDRVRFEIDGALRTVTLDRPDKGNAMDAAMLRELEAAFDPSPGPGPAERVAVIRAEGRVFCAGLDLRGDLFVYTGPDATHTYTYTLRYKKIGTTTVGTIVANAQGPKRGQSLGVLNTSTLAPGRYQAILELHMDGSLLATVNRPFTIVP